MFDSAGPKHSSELTGVFILQSPRPRVLKYGVKKKIADVFRAISEIVGNSVLIPNQNPLNNLVYFKLNSSQQPPFQGF